MKINPQKHMQFELSTFGLGSSRPGLRPTIHSRLIRLVLACAVPVWLVAGFLVYHAFDSKRALVTGHMLETAHAMSMSVDQELAIAQAALQALATSPAFSSGDLAGMHNQALELLHYFPEADIIVADASGQQLVNSYRPFGSSLPKRKTPKTVQHIFQFGKPIVSDLYFGAVTKRPLIAIDVPVFRKGEVAYDLSMTLPSERLAAILSHQHLPPEWHGTILDSKGIVVARTRNPQKFVGKMANPEIRRAIAGSTEGIVEVTNLEGATVFDAFSRSKTSNWTVVIGIPTSIAMKSMYSWLGWAMGCASILSLFGIAMAIRFGNSIAQSIQSLLSPAMALGSGEPVTDMSPYSIRETEYVAEALLQASRLLEKRAAERDRAEDKSRQLNVELAAAVENLLGEIAIREKAEESVLRLNRLYAVLSETNQAIVRTKNQNALFNDFCRIAVENGSFKLAWVGLVDEESGELKIAAANGATGYLEDILITANEEPNGVGPTGISVREGTEYICNDFLGSPITRPWHEKGKVHGIQASASIALKQEERVIGALTLYADQKDFFDQQQVELLRQMGADVSFALDSIAREARHREAEQALRDETIGRLRVVEALREKEQMLIQQSRLAAMGEMIGNIAHQWRQPLNTLGLVVQQISLFNDYGKLTKESLNKSVLQSMTLIQHMSKTIDDFRNYFRPDKEKVDFRVAEAIGNTLKLIEDSFKNQNITIEVVTKDDLVIHAYRNEFTQVLLNILNNARDALMERKIDDPRVTITLGTEAVRAVVTIYDNAGGIPEEIIDKIFEPYFTTKGPQDGTGIGLFMSKTIIEKNMRGSLSVRNTAEGAEFRIEV